MANSYPTAGSSMLGQYAPGSNPNPSSNPGQFYLPAGRPTGGYVTPNQGTQQYQSPIGPSPYSGNTTMGGGSTQQVTNPYAGLQPPSGPSNAEIDNLFSSTMNTYNQAESNLRDQLPGLISEAEAQANASKGLLENQRTGANELLGSQQLQTKQSQQNQTAQQRQTLQELGQSNQQRFGGASSAGQAAGELQGREFQRNTFQIGQQAEQALQQINQQKQVVEREFQQGLQQLEVNKQTAVNQIQRTFQDKLLEINSRRGETESAKAQMRMSALQELRNAAYQIDVSKAQFQAQLQQQAQQNHSYLDSAASQYLSATNTGAGAVSGFSSAIPSPISSVQTGQQAPSKQLAGVINRDEMNGMIGSINPNIRDQGLFA